MNIEFDLTRNDFKENFLYKKPYLFKQAVKDHQIDWHYINEVYERADVASRNFKLMNGYEVSKEEYIESFTDVGILQYKCIKSILYSYLRNGATLVHNRIKNEPKIDKINKVIANFAQAQTIVSGYAAFSGKSSYKSHWDTRDVFAVQLIGKKRWILKSPNFESPLYMQQTKFIEGVEEPEEVYMDIILEAGDILYIPRGWWHNPLPLDGETFHLAIGTFPPTGLDYLKWLVNLYPNILSVRKNLNEFSNDLEILENISENISELILSKNNYLNFIESYIGEHRVTSMLSLDILGNNKVDKIKPNNTLKINANLIYDFEKDFYIINGNKVLYDSISFELINLIYTNPDIKIGDVFAHFKNISEDNIESLVFKLCMEDIIEINI